MNSYYLHIFLFYSIFLFFGSAGCLDDIGVGPNLRELNRCSDDSDCRDSGGRCHPELRACVIAELQVDETAVLYISDPQTGRYTERRIELDSGETEESVSLTIDEPLMVRGLILDERDDFSGVPGQIFFMRQSEYDGFNFNPIYADVEAELASADDFFYNYQVELTPGLYEVVVNPNISNDSDTAIQNYYPLRSTLSVGQIFEAGTGNFSYTAKTRMISSVISGADGVPLGGVEVYAFHPDTYQRISNIAVTRCDESDNCGRFTIAVPETTSVFKLHLSGSDTGALLPSIEVPNAPIDFNAYHNREPVDLLDYDEVGGFSFPELEPPVLYETIVFARLRNGETPPLADASIEIRSVETTSSLNSESQYELHATTDSAGNLIAQDEGLRGNRRDGTQTGILLRPGEYEVTVTTPTSSEYATTRTTVTIVSHEEQDPPQEFLHIFLNSRSELSGYVLSPSRQPIPFAELEVTNSDGASFATISDEFGYFSLLVDRQLTDILCIPPEESLLSWSRLFDVNAFDDNSDLEVTVGLGTPIIGVVQRGESFEPLSTASIDAYVVRQDPDGPTVLVPIARLHTDTDGQFTFLVPGQWIP